MLMSGCSGLFDVPGALGGLASKGGSDSRAADVADAPETTETTDSAESADAADATEATNDDAKNSAGTAEVTIHVAVQEKVLTHGNFEFLAGVVELVQGDEKDFPQYRLWAALDFDDPVVFKDPNGAKTELSRIQLGPVATEGYDQDFWRQYEGQRVVVRGKVQGQTWNYWHLTPCSLEDASIVGYGEGRRSEHRDEVVEAFVTEVYTNYHLENGEYVHEDRDYQHYISPASELYAWQDGNDEGETVLILGNPCRVASVDIAEVIGDAYIVDVCLCGPESSLQNESARMSRMVIVLNNEDLVEHMYR